MLPGRTEGIPGELAKRRFIMLCNRMSASRIPTIWLIGMMWKQELQKRGEVHFHMMLYGVIGSFCLSDSDCPTRCQATIRTSAPVTPQSC